jgi:hypothetical protein
LKHTSLFCIEISKSEQKHSKLLIIKNQILKTIYIKTDKKIKVNKNSNLGMRRNKLTKRMYGYTNLLQIRKAGAIRSWSGGDIPKELVSLRQSFTANVTSWIISEALPKFIRKY